MNTGVTIRRVSGEDAAAAWALHLEMLADTPLAYIMTLAECAGQGFAAFAARTARGAAGGHDATFVAESGRRLVASAGGYAHPGEPGCTVLYVVYVTPAHRGTGVLAELVDAIAGWSRAHDRDRLELDVVIGNARAARAYDKLGFEKAGGPIAHPTIGPLREQRMVRRA